MINIFRHTMIHGVKLIISVALLMITVLNSCPCSLMLTFSQTKTLGEVSNPPVGAPAGGRRASKSSAPVEISEGWRWGPVGPRW